MGSMKVEPIGVRSEMSSEMMRKASGNQGGIYRRYRSSHCLRSTVIMSAKAATLKARLNGWELYLSAESSAGGGCDRST
jgi:hypothetical protein